MILVMLCTATVNLALCPERATPLAEVPTPTTRRQVQMSYDDDYPSKSQALLEWAGLVHDAIRDIGHRSRAEATLLRVDSANYEESADAGLAAVSMLHSSSEVYEVRRDCPEGSPLVVL